jgi:hypothetical protein
VRRSLRSTDLRFPDQRAKEKRPSAPKGTGRRPQGISCSPRRLRHPAVRYGLRDCLMLSVRLSWMASVAQMAQLPLGFRRRRVKEPGAFRRCVRRCHPRTRRRCEAMERLGALTCGASQRRARCLRDAGAAADRADIGVQVVESRVSAGGPRKNRELGADFLVVERPHREA